MASRDLVNDIEITNTVYPIQLTGAAAVSRNGATVDLQGSESCTFVISLGNQSDSDNDRDFTFTAQHSDSANSDFTDIPAEFLIGQSSAMLSLDAADIPNSAYGSTHKVGYKGIKRYVRMNYTITAGDAADILRLCVLVIGGHPLDRPKPLPASRLDEDHRDE